MYIKRKDKIQTLNIKNNILAYTGLEKNTDSIKKYCLIYMVHNKIDKFKYLVVDGYLTLIFPPTSFNNFNIFPLYNNYEKTDNNME